MYNTSCIGSKMLLHRHSRVFAKLNLYKQLNFWICRLQAFFSLTSIEQYVLRILSFLPCSFSQKLSYFVFGSPWTPFFFSSPVNIQLVDRPRLETRLIDASFRIKHTIASMVYCSQLPNMVSADCLWRIRRSLLANQKERNILNEL